MKKIIAAIAITVAALVHVPTHARTSYYSGGSSGMIPADAASGSRIVNYFTWSEDGYIVACVEKPKDRQVSTYGECQRGKVYVPIQQLVPTGRTYAGHGYISYGSSVSLVLYWK